MKFLRILTLLAIVSISLVSCEKTQQLTQGEAYLVELREAEVEPFNTISKDHFEEFVSNSIFDETTFMGLKSYSILKMNIGERAIQLATLKLSGRIDKNVSINKFKETIALGKINGSGCTEGKVPRQDKFGDWHCPTGTGCCVE